MLLRTTRYEWNYGSEVLVLEDAPQNRDLTLTYFKVTPIASESVYLTHHIPRGNVQTVYWMHLIDDQKHENPLEVFQGVKQLTIARSSALTSS